MRTVRAWGGGGGSAEEQDRDQKSTPAVVNWPTWRSSWAVTTSQACGFRDPTCRLRHLPQSLPDLHTASSWARLRLLIFRYVLPPAYLNATTPNVPWIPPTPAHPGFGGQAQGTKVRAPATRVESSLTGVRCRVPVGCHLIFLSL